MMTIYNVPEDVRKQKIEKVLAMDYLAMGQKTLEQFKTFVAASSEQIFNDLINGIRPVKNTVNT